MTMPMAVEIDAAMQKYAAARASVESKLDMNPTKARTTPPNTAGNISGSNVHHILSRGANSDGGAITPSKTASIRTSAFAKAVRERMVRICLPYRYYY